MMQALMQLYTRVMAQPALLRLNQMLAVLGLRGAGFLNAETLGLSGESWFLGRVARMASSPVVLDIGANCGRYAIAARQAMPRARIVAVEAHPAVLPQLRAAAARYDLTVIDKVCSTEEGPATLYDFVGPGNNPEYASLSQNVVTQMYKQPAVAHAVRATTIDAIASALDLDHISLLKIDTEGYELPILRGAKTCIATSRIDAIQFEYNRMHQIMHHTLEDFCAALPGYGLYRLLPNAMVPLDAYSPTFRDLPLFQNIIALRRDGELSA